MRKVLTAVLLAVTLFGCATAQKMNNVSLGMTKAEVIAAIGPPTSTAAKDGLEYMSYAFYDTAEARRWGMFTPYFVRIRDGRVDSYGRRGDFDSTKAPEQTLNLNVNKTSANP